MALRTAILLLALLGTAISLQAVVGDEVVSMAAAATGNVVDKQDFSGMTLTESLDDVGVVDGESLDAGTTDDEEDVADPELDVDGDIDMEGEVHDQQQAEEALSPAHPLARILTSRSSQWCWSRRNCEKFYKQPGCCNKKCVNFGSDNSNCGACGKRCNTRKGYRCTSSKCRKPNSVTGSVNRPTRGTTESECGKHKMCVQGYSCCNGRCVKLTSDNQNCGTCGKTCTNGYSCQSSKCKNSRPTQAGTKCWKNKDCKSGYSCCKGKCVNVNHNNGHCGKCDNGCNTKKGYSCKSGMCMKPTTPPSTEGTPPPTTSECGKNKSCKNGQSCCNGKCVSLASDNKHCGACDKWCDTSKGFSCKSSKCVKKPTPSQCGNTMCTPGQTCCNGAKCVSLSSDSNNCGQCGKWCDGKKGYSCQSGKCVKPKPQPPMTPQCGKDMKCRNGETCCKGKCVNLRFNNGHCGKCDNGCGYGSSCCHGTCKNMNYDDRNCGTCGTRCGYGKKCCYGNCVNVFGSDKNNCGACGKKCSTSCKFGMCGYGH